MKRKTKNGLLIGAFATTAAVASLAVKRHQSKVKAVSTETSKRKYDYEKVQAYFIGGGLASLAGAAYLIRDCHFKGENIHILEGIHLLGGSNDGSGTIEGGFVCRGGRMLNEETYENFW